MRRKSRVIVLASNAALRIRQGALEIEHGSSAERIKIKIDVDEPMPRAILFDGRGEFISGEAVRWSARRGIALIIPDGPGRLITIVHSALEATDGESLRDTGPAIVRAQCAADPVQVAREIVRTKIAAEAKAVGPRLDARGFDIARYAAKLEAASTIPEIMIVEAKAAAVFWRSHRDLGLVERKGGNLPRTWLRFANRGKGSEFLGNKHASHPISAMINYCIVVEAGRIARALTGEGMALQIGFLHSDKHGRNSLVWDCIEPLRAKINARVFEFIASREFSRSDFPASGVLIRRISRPIVAELLEHCLLPDQDILDAVSWLKNAIMQYGAPRQRQTRPSLRPRAEGVAGGNRPLGQSATASGAREERP
jgi:CRISPR/Cas system-associated endonuclease Cas1